MSVQDDLLRRNIPKMYLFKFLSGMHFFAGVLIPFFTVWGGITFAQVMWLQSWFVAWIFLFQVPTGAAADALGRKYSLMIGAALMAVASLAYVSRPDFRVFLFAELVWALAQAFVSGADQALGYDTLKAIGQEGRSKEIFGRAEGFSMAAIMVCAPIGGLIAARLGLRAPLLFMAGAFTLAALAALSFEEPPRQSPVGRKYLDVMLSGMRTFAGHPTLRALAFDSTAVWVLSFMMIWLFQPRLAELGVPMAAFGFVTAALTGGQVLLFSGFDKLERLCGGRRRFLLISGLIPGLAYLAVGLTRTPGPAIAAIVIGTVFGMGRGVLIASYMNKHIASENRATVLSSIEMARMLLQACVYPIVGWLAKISLPKTMLVLGAAILACALASRVEEGDLLD